MIVTMEIPDDLAVDLQVGFQDLNQAALEALAAEAILSKHGAWPGHSADEIFSDARTLAELRHAAS